MAETTVTRVGVRGGVAISPDGKFDLAIPASALQADTDITISIDRSVLDGDNASPIYVVGPADLALAADAELHIRVASVAADVELDIADIGAGGEPSFLDALIDERTMLLTTNTRRASSYVARRRPSRCIGLSCGDSCSIGPVQRACNAQGRCVLASQPLGCGVADGGVDAGPPELDAGSFDPDAETPDVIVSDGPDAGPADVFFPPSDVGPQVGGDGPVSGDGGTGIPHETEPNNDFGTQDLVAPGGTISGFIDFPGDVDMFAIDVPVAGTLTTYTYTQLGSPRVCQGIDTIIEVYDGQAALLGRNDDFNGIGCSLVTVAVDVGRYYVAVTAFGNQAPATLYYLDVLFTPGGAVDGGSAPDVGGGMTTDAGGGGGFLDAGGGMTTDAGGGGGGFDAGPGPTDVELEPNNDVMSANLLPSGFATIQGLLGAADHDYFAIDVLAPGTLTAYTYTQLGATTVCLPRVDTVLALWANGTIITQNDDAPNRIPCSLVSAPVTPGRYYLQVRNFAPNTANPNPYYLDVNVQ